MNKDDAADICRTRLAYGLPCRNCTLNGGPWCPAYKPKEKKKNGTEKQQDRKDRK